MDDARKLLDSLMGPSRDKDMKEQKRSDGWKERNVCKRFLVGFCPNDSQDNWFKNTRRDIGSCTKVHSVALKQQFEQHPDREKYQTDYEKDFLDYLEGLIHEADQWISRERKNCKGAGVETRIPPNLKQTIDRMKEQAEDLMKKAEDLAESGDVAGSKRMVDESGRLKQDIEEIRATHTVEVAAEEVCDICGVRCQPGEAADFQAHLDGKLHEGYTRIREKVKELREKVRAAPEKPQAERRASAGAEAKDRERRRSRSRSRRRGSRSRERRRRR
ncbi:unnamed protein product [Prorocentrum cordatum]|uniref:Luc7-like protein 3 n=1 Tax=Prorocentrum cordatum TaxID=2364126 RepID=A0ABN9Q9G0_9DINO|nr:unnamed protein product [Polarella glacialis]|mmetsp:Transcript_86378/g.234205  ORF Transcript_86378/g.234205 Transcript_86378/m.234205 type:complete len:274 (+) Transcript_86378:99-920(+)